MRERTSRVPGVPSGVSGRFKDRAIQYYKAGLHHLLFSGGTNPERGREIVT